MNIYISGGAKNGKSTFAENIAKEMSVKLNLPLYYIATMIPHDNEDLERINRHRLERKDKGFTTIECGIDIDSIKEITGVFLLDSITALLSNEMFRDGNIYTDSYLKVFNDLSSLIKRLKNVVMVSDFIYSNPESLGEYTIMYMKGLSFIDKKMVELSDKAYEVSFGNIKEIK